MGYIIMSRLEDIKKRVAESRPLPWKWEGYGPGHDDDLEDDVPIYGVCNESDSIISVTTWGGDPVMLITREDFLLLMHAKEDLEYLTNYVELLTLREQVKDLTKQILWS